MMHAAFQIEHVGTDRENNRELYVLDLATPDDMPQSLDMSGEYFTALIVWDAKNVPVDIIARFARRLIDAGGVYFCTWGRDCERVHDIIDEEWVGDGFNPASDETIMTTWHDDEPLADAIWFALFNAFPIDTYFDGCRSVIAICIDCAKSAVDIRNAFVNPRRFNDEVLGPND